MALGGDLAEDTIVNPGDEAVVEASVGVVAEASADALVVALVGYVAEDAFV